MATGHNRFSVIEELSSQGLCKIAAPVSQIRGGYPELPDLSDNPLLSYIYAFIPPLRLLDLGVLIIIFLIFY